MWSTDFGGGYRGLMGYWYFRSLTLSEWRFIILFISRYLGLVVNTIAHWRYKSIPKPKSPTFSSKDVTIILPTISTNVRELRQTIQSILACHPFQILLVTTEQQYTTLWKFSKSMNASNLKVLKIPVANKRHQVCKAIPFVKTRITVMVDDDVTWPKTILPWLLAPFEDEKMGAVGTCQRARRLKTGTVTELCYNWLGAVYIERRNFEISATHYIDGGTSCMSGRTCAVRTPILQKNDFLSGFATEKWSGRLLNADDDNFVTRWLVAKRWKTWVQYNRECEIETTLENNPRFCHQCKRWGRSNWRSNFTSLWFERHIWRQQPWSTYVLHLSMFTNFAIIRDPLLFWSCYDGTSSFEDPVKTSLRRAFFFWWLAAKNIKLIGLLKRRISDTRFILASMLFTYIHSYIKVHALLTLSETGWGSR